MGIFDFLSSKSFKAVEEKGDRLIQSNDLGLAKQQYEAALSRLERSAPPDASEHRNRLEGKIKELCESLARQNKCNAVELIEARCFEEAAELLALARDLTGDPQLIRDIDRLTSESVADAPEPPADEPQTMDSETFDPHDEAGHFLILCSTLPDEIQQAYMTYGHDFQTGYVALNNGEFDLAAEALHRAMMAQGDRITYVQLELATAYLHLGNNHGAQALLEVFVAAFPESIRAYQALCEIYWESEQYDQADRFLQNCPDTMKRSVEVLLLMGETLFRSGKTSDAVSFYRKSMEYLGWQEPLAIALARTLAAAGRTEKALSAYQEIMASCTSCRRRADPWVRHQYAELRYDAGDVSSELLEMYFDLCRENLENQDHYYYRISDIYHRQGYADEARRYLEIAQQLESGKP